jgi:S-DNA-T family DNA segregation ATPase FtsK/SpoIIIE
MKNELPPTQSREVVQMAETILTTFRQFGVEMKLISARDGLRAYHFELEVITPVRMKAIEGFLEDLKYALSTSRVIITAPIPDKKLIGIEVAKIQQLITASFEDALQLPNYTNGPALTVPLGVSEFGEHSVIDIARTPHLLIGGTTGSGKSTILHTFIVSLIKKHSPDLLRLLLVDSKRVEFVGLYDKVPHLLAPVITDSRKALLALSWATQEMERRYQTLEAKGCQNIQDYQKKVYLPVRQARQKARQKSTAQSDLPESMPYIVIVCDEVSDLMQSNQKVVEAKLIRLAQMSRAVGIHLIIATSRPSSAVISGAIKANIPSRIAFSTASYIDSRTLIDQNGAEKLCGSGDLLYCGTEDSVAHRYQGYAITEETIKRIVHEVGHTDDVIDMYLDLSDTPKDTFMSFITESDEDELYETAKQAVIEAGRVSTSYLQRKLRIGYSRAARLIDLLEEGGVIGPVDGAKPREVIEKYR